MTPEQLKRKIQRLPKSEPYTKRLSNALATHQTESRAWYKNQREHWLGWLSEIRGPGAYGRKKGHTSARTVYNRIVNPHMIFWLSEGAGVPKKMLVAAIKAATKSGKTYPSQAAAIRKVMPWEFVESLLTMRKSMTRQ